jgi:addiction module RelB/DinJ family antitoxin
MIKTNRDKNRSPAPQKCYNMEDKARRRHYMARTTTIRARTSLELKEEVEDILKQLGLNTTEAINVFFSQIRLCHGLPFEVKIPAIDAMIVKSKVQKAVKADQDPWSARMGRVVDRLREGAKGYSEKEIEKIVDDAVAAVRREGREKRKAS